MNGIYYFISDIEEVAAGDMVVCEAVEMIQEGLEEEGPLVISPFSLAKEWTFQTMPKVKDNVERFVSV